MLANVRDALSLPSDLLMFLLIVVVVAALGGFVPAFVCAITGFLLANWFFTPPYYEFTISEGENLVALVIFLVVGGVVSLLVDTASRRTADAARARAEAETLAALSGTLSASDDPLPQLVSQLQVAFDARHVAVLGEQPDDTWTVLAAAGDARCRRVPTTPTSWSRCTAREVLVLSGEALGDDDREVLKAFAGQVAIAVQQRELRADAERAEGLAEANELRTALLAAVSHDLRTPLSSIKASVTSLLQRDVDFTPAATRELLETIDEGTDRLNHLVGNLLDMSRLQTGALQLVMRDVGLDEVLPVAIAGLTQAERVDVDVDETLPRVRADAALLERAIANVVENAIAWSPAGRARAGRGVRRRSTASSCRWSTAVRGSRRRGARTCSGRSSGWATARTAAASGLGLAVARGFVEAMGGRIVGGGHAGRRRHDGDQPGRRGMTRVLVVDDEPQILRALGINLRARGYDVDLAPDGEQALTLAAATIPTSWSSTSGCPASTAST